MELDQAIFLLIALPILGVVLLMGAHSVIAIVHKE